MPGFYGLSSVIASRDKHLATGKVITTAVLRVRGAVDTFTSVTYANAYIWPITETTGLPDGQATQQTTGVLWQMGETTAPRVDDKLLLGSDNWLIVQVFTRLNADTDYAVHDLTLVRAS